jgi:hypothetical protein
LEHVEASEVLQHGDGGIEFFFAGPVDLALENRERKYKKVDFFLDLTSSQRTVKALMDSMSSEAVKVGLIFFKASLRDFNPFPASHSATALRITRDIVKISGRKDELVELLLSVRYLN